MFSNGRKFAMTMIGIVAVLTIGIGAAVLKKLAGIDITELAKWAMLTVAGAVGLGAGTIAYEDSRRSQ